MIGGLGEKKSTRLKPNNHSSNLQHCICSSRTATVTPEQRARNNFEHCQILYNHQREKVRKLKQKGIKNIFPTKFICCFMK